MIKASHHILIYPLFKWLTRFLLRRHFCSIQIDGEFNDKGGPVLVVANHISWWDGFWVEYLNQKIIHRKFYFMMREEQLKKHWYFQYTGGYPVKKNSRKIAESIDYTVELLSKNENLVLMFPQGKIHSAYNYSIRFERGIRRIVTQCHDATQVVFAANFTDYFSSIKPHLFIYIKTYPAVFLKNSNLEEEYNLFFTAVLNHHQTKTS